MSRWIGGLMVLAVMFLVSACNCPWMGGKSSGVFDKPVFDLGVVCADVDKSVAFYTEAIGLIEVDPFDVPADFGRDSGLSDGLPLNVRVLVLDEGGIGTKLKLMSFPDSPGKKSDESYIHSTLGYSYITIFVKDITASNARAVKAGVELIAKSPVPIAGTDLYLTLIKDPDGNIIELIGPKVES